MHCGLAIVLPDGVDFAGVESEVARIMSRYSENREVAPWLDEVTDTERTFYGTTMPSDLAMMRHHYWTDDLQELAEKMMDWSGVPGVVRDDKLYRVTTENPEGRHDGYDIMELSDMPFPNGIGLVRDFPQDEFCRALILPDGAWLEREPRFQDKDKGWQSYNPDEWTPIFQRLVREFPDNIIVTLDTHY